MLISKIVLKMAYFAGNLVTFINYLCLDFIVKKWPKMFSSHCSTYNDIQDSLKFLSRVIPTPKFRSIDVFMTVIFSKITSYFPSSEFYFIASVVVGAEVLNFAQLTNET